MSEHDTSPQLVGDTNTDGSGIGTHHSDGDGDGDKGEIQIQRNLSGDEMNPSGDDGQPQQPEQQLIVIHVNDDARKTSKDFYCDRDTLLK